jgi:hypothetical protein
MQRSRAVAHGLVGMGDIVACEDRGLHCPASSVPSQGTGSARICGIEQETVVAQ